VWVREEALQKLVQSALKTMRLVRICGFFRVAMVNALSPTLTLSSYVTAVNVTKLLVKCGAI
jgi:hypothetical protein